MLASIKDWLSSYSFTSWIALYTYWIPLVVCSVTYVGQFIDLYRKDLRDSQDDGKYYSPRLTVGWIVWRIIITALPCINLFAMVFDCAGSVLRWIGDALDIPLVKKRKNK